MNFMPKPQMAQPLLDQAIISMKMLVGDDGSNINGPSLIKVPEWLPDPLGQYYLYFGHHSGLYIRMAYADDLAGPWKIYEGGVIPLEEVLIYRGHLSSPDVLIDDSRHEIVMYHHGPLRHDLKNPLPYTQDYQGSRLQISSRSRSKDGLQFMHEEQVIAPYYLRAFYHEGLLYAVAWGGQLHRWEESLGRFEPGHFPVQPLLEELQQARYLEQLVIRHVAIDHQPGDETWLYFSCIGDQPEQIYRVKLNLDGAWETWTASSFQQVRFPERDWEGGTLPVKVSLRGSAPKAEKELRDPAIYREEGHVYLVYSVQGEQGLAIAEVMGE